MYPNVKLQLWRTGIRLNALAKILGMSESALSRIVNSHKVPDAALRKTMADLLQCDEVWLFKRVSRDSDEIQEVRSWMNPRREC